jgi:hypothetical protein
MWMPISNSSIASLFRRRRSSAEPSKTAFLHIADLSATEAYRNRVSLSGISCRRPWRAEPVASREEPKVD